MSLQRIGVGFGYQGAKSSSSNDLSMSFPHAWSLHLYFLQHWPAYTANVWDLAFWTSCGPAVARHGAYPVQHVAICHKCRSKLSKQVLHGSCCTCIWTLTQRRLSMPWPSPFILWTIGDGGMMQYHSMNTNVPLPDQRQVVSISYQLSHIHPHYHHQHHQLQDYHHHSCLPLIWRLLQVLL